MNSITDLQNDKYEQLINESTQSLKNYIIETTNKAIAENKPVEDIIDEGLLSALVGGVIGGTAGKSIMQAVCRALGVSENSTLGQLLTSRAVLTAVGSYLGYKW